MIKPVIILTLAMTAFFGNAFAAPKKDAPKPRRNPIRRIAVHNVSTNAYTLYGVEMPPCMTEADFLKREQMIADFEQKIADFDSAAAEKRINSFSERQRWAWVEQSKSNEVAQALAAANAKRREEELAWFTNRLAYVKGETTTGRRTERRYVRGCYWNGEEVSHSILTTSEHGKVCVEVLYTVDGKRYRIAPLPNKKEEAK